VDQDRHVEAKPFRHVPAWIIALDAAAEGRLLVELLVTEAVHTVSLATAAGRTRQQGRRDRVGGFLCDDAVMEGVVGVGEE